MRHGPPPGGTHTEPEGARVHYHVPRGCADLVTSEPHAAALSAGTLVSALRYEAKTLLARYPSLALPIARRRGHGEVLDDATEIVIEGYPRAASSFAVAAFRAAQGRPVGVAHHV